MYRNIYYRDRLKSIFWQKDKTLVVESTRAFQVLNTFFELNVLDFSQIVSTDTQVQMYHVQDIVQEIMSGFC